MIYQEGNFLITRSKYCPRPAKRYPCKITIHNDEWERLKMGKWEDDNELTPCIAWCHEKLNWNHWEVEYHTTYYTIYFSCISDATMFKMVWA